MRLLLDTCTFVWLNTQHFRLPQQVSRQCTDRNNELYLSVVSVWEIAAKHSAGRLALPMAAAQFVRECRAANGIVSLDLTEESALQLPKLPALHKDPFDRMLICQAIAHGLTILTPDPQIAQYPIRVMW